MNKRIKELADEAARFSAVMALPTGEPGDSLFVEKFAELIAADVINKAERYGLGCDAVEQLKEHFGVEE